jgi:hypothetical protein
MIMRSRSRATLALMLSTAAALAVSCPAARADVTVGQKTSMNVAGINIDIDAVERTSADKQRNDSTVTCHGFLSLFCHGVAGGRIVRLDKRVEWQLEPKKKLYTEHPFPTPEERAAAQQRLEAAMEEMKKCPMPQSPGASQRSAPDTSHCQLSSPVLNVNATDEHATILGHDARKSTVVLSQTCTDTQTGDVCEIDYGFDTWLTTDEIPGTEERHAFMTKYLQEQGLDPNNPQLQHTVAQFMAPYAQQLKQLQGKAGDLKGYPLRTTFYMAFGGPHCGKAKQAQQQQASSGGGLSMHSLATSALASGFSSLFHRGAAAIHADSAGGAAASSAANDVADPAANSAADSMTAQSSSGGAAAPAPAPGPMVRVVSLTTETTSIDTSSIPPDQFEIPADWKLKPQPQQMADTAPKCPTAGGAASD